MNDDQNTSAGLGLEQRRGLLTALVEDPLDFIEGIKERGIEDPVPFILSAIAEELVHLSVKVEQELEPTVETHAGLMKLVGGLNAGLMGLKLAEDRDPADDLTVLADRHHEVGKAIREGALTR